MTPFEQFAQELVSKIQTGPAPLDCSRVDIALSSENDSVVVLLYARPQLTEWMLTIPPFQYPLPLLLNSRLLYQYVEPDVRSGKVTLSLSELMRAAMVGVAQYNSFGTMISPDASNGANMTFYVPLVEVGDRASPQSILWGTMLFDPVSEVNDKSEIAQLVVIHMPAFSVSEMSNEQLLQITRLALGWNYSRVLDEDKLQHMVEVFSAAAKYAQTIAEF